MGQVSNHNEGESGDSPTPEEEKAMLEKGGSEGFEGNRVFRQLSRDRFELKR